MEKYIQGQYGKPLKHGLLVLIANNKIINLLRMFMVLVCLGLALTGCKESTTESAIKAYLGEFEAVETQSDEENNNSLHSFLNNDKSKSISLPISCRNTDITKAHKQKISYIQVKGCGYVRSLISDTVPMHQYQRFKVELTDVDVPHQVIVLHDIEHAAHIEELHIGDLVTFYGVYDYLPEGGLVKWTDDNAPQEFEHGWIEREGIRYN